jgi:hypothetical protein
LTFKCIIFQYFTLFHLMLKLTLLVK